MLLLAINYKRHYTPWVSAANTTHVGVGMKVMGGAIYTENKDPHHGLKKFQIFSGLNEGRLNAP